MIGLDTNILVRLFAADDPVQRRAAVRLIEGLAVDDRAVVNVVVVVELLWTLRRVYKFAPYELARVVRQLTDHPRLLVPDKDILRDAAHRSLEEGGDIPDHIIALLNRGIGCRTTMTFDGEAAKNADFELLPA
jgi:predicted nucleic-acid-binding protein